METRPGRRILVPTDFSDTADAALERAIQLARALGASIDLLHVTAPVLVLPPPIDILPLPTLYPDLPQRIEAHLEERAARARAAGVTCNTVVRDGPPHVEIGRVAEDSAVDLIAMGTHGRSGIGHAVLGSVAERVLHRARCPVLVVPVRA
jgi:nucleotide-binding universal stress UspA family protein